MPAFRPAHNSGDWPVEIAEARVSSFGRAVCSEDGQLKLFCDQPGQRWARRGNDVKRLLKPKTEPPNRGIE